MNHFREVIEEVESGEMQVALGVISEVQDLDFMRCFSRIAERAICFYADVENINGITPIEHLCKKMPFEVCWFEFYAQEAVGLLGVLVRSFDVETGFYVFRRLHGRWCFIAIITTDNLQVRSHVGELKNKLAQEILPSTILSLVRTFLTAMRCNNVERHETRPSEKLQKARTKRGKKPLFSFWTLALKRAATEKVSNGGTHSSPRLHLRCGHPRQYSPGKWTWVQPCAVGNIELGMVHKDYLLKPDSEIVL